jgi:hypothetical protein
MGRDFVGKSIFSSISQIRIHYRNATLSNHNDDATFKVKSGDRMPYFLVGRESIYDQLRAPKFHLLDFSDRKHQGLDLQPELENEYNHLIAFKHIPLGSHITEIFGTTQSFKLLLRPDNYIGLIATEISSVNLKTYMREALDHA